MAAKSMDPLPQPSPESLSAREERTWAMVAHLSAFAGHVFPFAHIIAPLIVWLVKRDTSAFVNDQGKEAVNAQISVTLYAIIGIPLCLVVVGAPLLFVLWATQMAPLMIPAVPFCLGLGVLILLPLIYVANFILIIVAGIAANEGRAYRYPFIFRLIK
jgi:uncharacterized Tic20 family protein